MKFRQGVFYIIGVLSLVTLSRCNIGDIDSDIELPNYQAEHGLAVGTATYTIREFIEELQDSSLFIEEDNAKLLKVIYRDTVNFEDANQFIVLDDISNPGIIEPELNIPSSPIDESLVFTQDLQFEYPIAENEELDSIVYSGGSITLAFESSFSVDLEYTFTLNDVINRENEEPMIFTGVVLAGGNGNQTLNLINHRTVATRIANENIFTGVFVGTLIVKTGDTVSPIDDLSYSFSINDIEYTTIYGYFGEKNFDVESQTVDLGFFEDISESGLSFRSPEIRFIVENSFGVPIGLDLSNIFSSNISGQTVSLTGQVTDNLQFVNAPGATEVGQTKTSLITINNDKSNLSDLLSIAPNQMSFDIKAQSNFMYDSLKKNFIDINSKADIFMEFEMPLEVKLLGFSRDFGFSKDSIDFEDADTVDLIIKSTNFLPINGIVDLQFLEDSITIINEIPDILLIESPVLEASGRAEEPNETTAVIKLYDDILDDFLNATSLNLVMHVSSYDAENDTYVKIYSDYQLELKVSLEVNLDKEL